MANLNGSGHKAMRNDRPKTARSWSKKLNRNERQHARAKWPSEKRGKPRDHRRYGGPAAASQRNRTGNSSRIDSDTGYGVAAVVDTPFAEIRRNEGARVRVA